MNQSIGESPAAIPELQHVAVRTTALGPPAKVVWNPTLPEEARREILQQLEFWASDPGRSRGARIVKNARRRTVVRIDSGGVLPVIYIKQERILGFWNRLRTCFQSTHAALEFRNAEIANRHGVDAPRALAYAQWKRGGTVYFTLSILEELPGGSQLDVYLSSGGGGEAPVSRVETAARLLAGMHGKGVDLTDCHRANVFITEKLPDFAPRIAILDLATVVFGHIPLSRRVARVAQLLHSLEGTLDPASRRGFAEAYAQAAGVPDIAVDAFVRRVREMGAKIGEERERSRDKRCVTPSSSFVVTRRPGSVLFHHRDIPPSLPQAVREQLKPGTPGTEIIKNEGRTICYKVTAGGTALFVKTIAAAGPGAAITDLFRGSRCRRAWFYGNAMMRRGLPAPRPILEEDGGWLLPWRSMLAVEWIEGAQTLQVFTTNFGSQFKHFSERRFFIEKLALAVARLHNHGVDHDDLALKNILVRKIGDLPHGFEFLFIDLEAVQSIVTEIPRDRVLRALMQLDDAPRTVTRADRIRFLSYYERATRTRFVKSEIAEIRRMLHERFERSRRDYAATGPR